MKLLQFSMPYETKQTHAHRILSKIIKEFESEENIPERLFQVIIFALKYSKLHEKDHLVKILAISKCVDKGKKKNILLIKLILAIF